MDNDGTAIAHAIFFDHWPSQIGAKAVALPNVSGSCQYTFWLPGSNFQECGLPRERDRRFCPESCSWRRAFGRKLPSFANWGDRPPPVSSGPFVALTRTGWLRAELTAER